MANPGYGKRAASGQLPRTNYDFAHLPPREAAIAAYLDRLPDGADISVKTLAKQLPSPRTLVRLSPPRPFTLARPVFAGPWPRRH
jgi:hypothetical protein